MLDFKLIVPTQLRQRVTLSLCSASCVTAKLAHDSLRRWFASAAVIAVAGAVAFPSAVAAQTQEVFLDGAGLWVSSGCAGEVPVVVASDAAAQSDIYSAVTLAGAVGTRCVVLAGQRDAPVPPRQQARMREAASGGYVVGGVAAVPASKIAGREMTRIAGRDRWATAHLVGQYAAGSSLRDLQNLPGSAAAVAADVQQAGVYLDGAGLWVSSDCAGQVPVVVASDAAAQSDIYSAVTLAGAVGTRCVILAGSRDAPVPQSQQVRMSEAASGGYVVGGTAAVQASKIAGRDMTRIAGRDRWATAHLVGRLASGDSTAGRSTDATLAAATAGGAHSCGLRSGGAVSCWGDDEFGQSDAPSGEISAIAAGGAHSCALRPSGTVTCWGNNEFGQSDAPSGVFSAVVAGGAHSCALQGGGAVLCWGNDQFGQSDAPSGVFMSVVAGGAHSCGLRPDGAVTCWGNNQFGQSHPATALG